MTRYLIVLGAAVSCYLALGAVLRILPHLDSDPAVIGLAVGAPALTAVLARPLGGRLSDRTGPPGIVVAGALIMTAGAPLALVDGAVALVASRLIVGVGEGLMMAASVAWLLREAPAERQGRALGHIGLANYGGLALGPLLADALGAAHTVIVAAALLPLPAAAAAAILSAPEAAPHQEDRAGLRGVLRPGTGLLLVNVGYTAVLAFGAKAAMDNGAAGASLVLPVFAGTVILARTAGASIPDRAGPRLTLMGATPAAAAGLVLVAVATTPAILILGVVALAGGQALAVPALGLIALAGVPEDRRGAAAGLFFAFFDLGVGLSGPVLGLIARATAASGALIAGAAGVAAVVPVSRPRRTRAG
jgi:MFS family permease